ncbi:MAG TPA: Crp/Fnr family transcriptional regulator [Puia sp.]|jgi:CRP-like cAMP-binding protein
MEEIIQNINAIYPLSDEVELLLRKSVRRDVVRKKQKLLRMGQICTRLYFIEQGLLRHYVKRGEKEHSCLFMLEGDIATSVTSFFGRTPSPETIEALEDCVLWSVSWQELQDIYERDPGFRKIGQHYTEKYYCQDDRLKMNLIAMPPGEFYDYLRENFPKVVQRVPDKYLASSMGITVQTLMAIKRRMKLGGKKE